MSQRAAWQLDRLGVRDVYDFVVGKAHWLASGRPTIRNAPVDRVGDHLDTNVAVVDIDNTVGDTRDVLVDHELIVVVNAVRIVIGAVRASDTASAASDAPIASVMRFGPPTIRPDEDTAAVLERMARRNVASLIVTTPTGRLLGVFTRR